MFKTEKLKRGFGKLYEKIFGHTPGEFSKKFFKNLLYAFFGIGSATFITFGFNILVIRYIGPVEYGKFNLIVSAGEFLAIPVLWGFSTSALRYLGAEREKKDAIIGSAFRSVIFLGFVFSVLFFFFRPFIAPYFKISSDLYNLAIVYSLVTAFFYLFQSFFQGLEKFKNLSYFWLASAFVFVLAVIYYLFVLRNFSFESLFWGNMLRLFFVIAIGIVFFRSALFKFDRKVFKEVFNYGTFSMLSVFAGFFSLGNLDNLMINYYLGAAAVGLYSAYYMSFNIFTGKVLNTVSQVFLPMASGHNDIKALYDKVITFGEKAGLVIFAGNFFLIWILFKFYGKAFAFDWRVAVLMALSITLYFFLMILGNINASMGIRAVKLGFIYLTPTGPLLNIFLNWLLIPRMGIAGAILGTIITSTILFYIAVKILFKLIKTAV